jgi:peptidoglycan/xylan/chitin deacetylase (PgdA/CDA1 family)
LSRDAARYGLASLTRRRARPAAPARLILLHHDVAESGDDPSRSLTPALAVGVLREQLEYLRRQYHVVSLAELASVATLADVPGRLAVALTFDDDLSSHHQFVAPLLTELGLPATFFLTGATLGGQASFWWHDLQQLYRSGGERWRAVTKALAARWGEPRARLSLGTAATTIEAAPAGMRDEVAADLRRLAADLPTDPGLSARAVDDLHRAGFEIGFHTRAHYQLQTLSDEELHTAMRDGRDRLAEAAGTRLTRIAYPHGAADLRVAAAAAEAGFGHGYTVQAQLVPAEPDPLLIPRLDAYTSASRLALSVARLVANGA